MDLKLSSEFCILRSWEEERQVEEEEEDNAFIPVSIEGEAVSSLDDDDDDLGEDALHEVEDVVAGDEEEEEEEEGEVVDVDNDEEYWQTCWTGLPDGGFSINECESDVYDRDLEISTARTLYNNVQQFAGFPTHFLFMAVELVDYFTSISAMLVSECQLVACAAQKIVLDLKPQFTVPEATFLEMTGGAYTRAQLRHMMNRVERALGSDEHIPNPYNYLAACFKCCERFASPISRAECYLMCRYILELGLTDSRLVPYSAILRCCAVVYLIRRILRNYFVLVGDRRAQEFRLWPQELQTFTGVCEDDSFYTVAYLYGMKLSLALTLNHGEQSEEAQHLQTAFHKYRQTYYHAIATSPVLTTFTLLSAFPPGEDVCHV
ncbi:unnamed protein product [Hydatigera taeniaeformis]|uniref:Cyclin_C domain-containing protein n=1 Tax=Hydatigena taeniaeformis TaxID=6205 RepID=A0A0R3WPV2_HYDTA|nr:unnamed protein product [Hydatigera taeniaeformis]